MTNSKRSIRDIPLNPKRKAEDALNWKESPVVPTLKRDVEAIPDMTEELLREEQPLEHAQEIAHVDVKEKTPEKRKIRISDGTRVKKIRSYAVEPAMMTSDDEEVVKKTKDTQSYSNLQSSHHKSKFIISTLVIVCVGLFILFGTFFSRARITIVTQTNQEHLENTALSQPVTYQAFTTNTEKTVTVNNPKTIALEQKATGEVLLYNNYSTAPYELVATTRLETANGSVYRLLSDTKIPGKKTSGGKDVPGSITVKVQADKPGDIYNARPGLELFIPGLIKGTGKYTNIYGKTANQFTGGNTGETLNTNSDQVKQAIESTKQAVSVSATEEFVKSNPEFTLLKDSVQVLTTTGSTQIKDGTAKIDLKITVKAIGLLKSDVLHGLNTLLAEKKLVLKNETTDSLQFAVAQTSNDIILKDKFNITAKGDVQVLPYVQIETIQNTVAGQPVSTVVDLIQKDVPENSVVSVKLTPFWKKTIPKNPERIDVRFAEVE